MFSVLQEVFSHVQAVVSFFILGTLYEGMVESIVAAACSRIHKNVLHLDSSDHYGGLWASYNFDGLQKFIKEVNSDPEKQVQVYNLMEQWYIEK